VVQAAENSGNYFDGHDSRGFTFDGDAVKTIKWPVFACAALVAWMFLFAFNAPVLPVFAGTGAMALWNHLHRNG
jgi:hypothetical protein